MNEGLVWSVRWSRNSWAFCINDALLSALNEVISAMERLKSAIMLLRSRGVVISQQPVMALRTGTPSHSSLHKFFSEH